jgi:hypothetical protein
MHATSSSEQRISTLDETVVNKKKEWPRFSCTKPFSIMVFEKTTTKRYASDRIDQLQDGGESFPSGSFIPPAASQLTLPQETVPFKSRISGVIFIL